MSAVSFATGPLGADLASSYRMSNAASTRNGWLPGCEQVGFDAVSEPVILVPVGLKARDHSRAGAGHAVKMDFRSPLLDDPTLTAGEGPPGRDVDRHARQ